jgi:hypothetical protein
MLPHARDGHEVAEAIMVLHEGREPGGVSAVPGSTALGAELEARLAESCVSCHHIYRYRLDRR